MALNTAGINALLDDGNEAVVYAAIGSGPNSGDQSSTARILLTLAAPSGGIIATSNVPLTFTGTPGAAASHVLLFSASVAGTFYGSQPLSGGQVFSPTGQYLVTSLTVVGSSS